MANCEIEALIGSEGKSVDIMACWQDDNKVLSHNIATLEAKLLKALSQEGNDNKSQGQDNSKLDWLDLEPSDLFLLLMLNMTTVSMGAVTKSLGVAYLCEIVLYAMNPEASFLQCSPEKVPASAEQRRWNTMLDISGMSCLEAGSGLPVC
ncbi:hypothetical protein DSO57_1017230 [Entomophthora muscae]|uniref:Uncharacterized protein n=1 Tax=Entomophthora muscae TaxID=34485 RepID=A0ACC2SU74_9FUNG|nr:hypothetical protein DSO57_1017230 [Entomophthora muscae]